MSTPGSGSVISRRGAALDLLAGLLPAAVGAGAFAAVAGASLVLQVGAATAIYAAVAVGILQALPPGAPGPGLGAANRITLGRMILALPLVGATLLPGVLSDGVRWWVVVLGTVVLILDGVDGRVARRTGTTTRFGARFDMETDAALMMVLSVLVWRTGQAGAWVLAIGGMRYAFVAAVQVLPALRGDLPPSRRRKVVCVVQGVVLVAALGPIIPQGLATAMCVLALAMLAWSFGVDVLWLVRHEPEPLPADVARQPSGGTGPR
ncbi:MAG: CDP-alcohol phosphatidyltransferase family protein [Longimicrobiales bacterium]